MKAKYTKMEKLRNLKFCHFEQIHKNGYTLDMVFLLLLAEENVDIKTLCESSPKLGVLYQGIYRKGLITADNKITLSGKAVLEFLNAEAPEETKLVKKKVIDDVDSILLGITNGTLAKEINKNPKNKAE